MQPLMVSCSGLILRSHRGVWEDKWNLWDSVPRKLMCSLNSGDNKHQSIK